MKLELSGQIFEETQI